MTDTLDRLQGALSTLGMKTPVRVATTANITLSGLQSIDGVTVAEDDRVLVKDQTDDTENGVYAASTGEWSRTKDFDGASDFALGTVIPVAAGTVNVGTIWRVSSAAIETIGEDDITFAQLDFTSVEVGADIATGSSINLNSTDAEVINVTGSGATITAITLADGKIKIVRFEGANTLTHSSTLVLPGALNITTAAGDFAIFCGYASSIVRCAAYSRGNSQPLVAGQTTIASAATTDLGAVREQSITISGSTPITSFGTSAQAGTIKFCTLSGAILLTNGANLVLPQGINIQGASGDSFIAKYEGSSVWRVLNYSRVTPYSASTTDASTTTAETDLASHTVAAGRLGSAGEFITAKAWGSITTASTAATRRVRMYFDGTACADSSAIAQTGGKWQIEADIVRETAAGVETFGKYVGSTAAAATPYVSMAQSFITTTLGSSVELKVTGLCTGSSGIISLTGFVVNYGSR